MHMPVSRLSRTAIATATLLGLSTLSAPSTFSAPASAPAKTSAPKAAKKVPASLTGTWFQEVPPAHFPIKPGTQPNQVVLTIPAELIPLPAQDYVLTRKNDTTWAFNGADLPTVTLTLESANKATLNLRGKGKTAKGSWFVYQVMNLKRVP